MATRPHHHGPICGRIRRRTFLADVGMGFTGLVLGAMLHRDHPAGAAPASTSVPPSGLPHFPPKASRIIWVYLSGGVSHLETWDPKPALNKYAGKTIDESPFKKAVLESPYYRKNVRDFAGTLRNLMPKLFDYRTVEFTTTVPAGKKADLLHEVVRKQGYLAKQNNVTLEAGEVKP